MTINTIHPHNLHSTQHIFMALPRSISLALLLVVAQIVPHISQKSNHHHQHSTTTKCLEVERQALIQFKQGLSDPGHRLSSWTGDDCCSWSGITCSNLTTGHVIKLNLRILPQKLAGSDTSEEINVSKALVGELHPSLLHLEHLQYLDLSNNDFQGLGIPNFIGSFKELKYLNLSAARFSGIIPHHLENLSTLQSLDLSENMILIEQHSYLRLTIGNANWLSGLISLKNLNLNFVNLIEASNWLHTLNMLPSLQKIQLKGCIISSPFPSLQHVNFTSLTLLDLTSNSIGPSIPHWLFNLNNLQYLYLGSNNFQGPIPATIGNLSSLISLDLSYNFQLQLPITIGNFCNLEPLGFSAINGCFKHSLRELFLSNILTPAQIPDWIGDLKNLKVLDLSCNSINSIMPSWFSNLTAMSYLDLSLNDLHGSIPPLIDSMLSLEVLMLFDNFHLEVPTLMTLGNLCKLKILELNNVKITQKLNEFGGTFSGCIRNSLQELNLQNTSLAGQLPTEIGNLRNLRVLNLADNNLSGSVPKSFGQLLNLVSLHLESNNLDGVLDEATFTNLKHLNDLYLDSNSLILNVSEDWIPPFQLEMISMGSCIVGPQFPAWLQTQDQLSFLNFSNSNISDVMPNWFWNLTKNIQRLDLSHNKISGMMPLIPPMLQAFFLTDNLFFGEISLSSNSSYPNLLFLHLSINNINGTIPPTLCNLSHLEMLDISWNYLSGELPDCWKENSNFMVLDFSNNNIFGEIPGSIFSSSSRLSSLHLSKNIFSGLFPSLPRRCERLVTLDIGHNKLYGHIPQWISKCMPNLKVLILRSNNFSGALPPELSALAQLHILDLSNNNFSGTIPKSYADFNAMRLPNQMRLARDYYGYYEENIQLIVKGNEHTYDKILRLLNAMDLSNNYLNGSIPEELANLVFLQSLNLSGNHFTGEITNMIGRMRALESLDLSRNNISGAIPSSLGNLDYLGRLNLSFNNLSGKIPTENHFHTFTDDKSIYIGNYDLCGPPLTKNCPGEEQPPPTSDHWQEDESHGLPDNVFFYLGIGSGFLVGLWTVFIILLFKKTGRTAYFRCLDDTYNQIYVAAVVNCNRLRRKYEEQEH